MAKSILLAALVAISVAGCNTAKNVQAQPNVLTESEKKEGWRLLFDGTTKNGWHVFNKRGEGAAWKVSDGVLYLDPAARGERGVNGGDIISDEEFENFHFKLEWKLDSAGNSGVIFQAIEDPKYRWAWLTGPEMQIIDNNAHPDAKNNKHRAGDLYDLVAASPENVKPIGQWNLLEIMSKDGKLDLYMNGAKVVSTTQWDDNWKQLISKSKFAKMEDFGKFRKGKISLQDHGDKVYFRNIKIRNI